MTEVLEFKPYSLEQKFFKALSHVIDDPEYGEITVIMMMGTLEVLKQDLYKTLPHIDR